MKILVLMPCDERMVYVAAKIYKELPNDMKDITFLMPMFMDYLVTTEIVGNWVYAFYDAFLGMKNLYKTAKKEKKNLIIFGTAPKNFKFDAIFNFQDHEFELPYEDKFLQKIKEISTIDNLYEASDSIFTLTNCKATADFLTEYIKTDPKLDELKEKYSNLNFKEDGENHG